MHIILKVLFLLIIIFNISIQAFPIPKDNKATYDVIRKNKIIGTYEILFSENNGNLILETNIDIEVKVFFVTAYKFSHKSKEIWNNDNFVQIDGYTNFEDEREYFIKGEKKDDFLYASGMEGELKLDKNLIPSNYWNQEVMYQNARFDTQKGIVRKLDVKEAGIENIEINNILIECNKFILNATRRPKDKGLFPEYTLWYSIDKELMKFEFKNPKDNKIVTFVRKE